MFDLKVNLPYRTDEKVTITSQQITKNILVEAVRQSFRDGIGDTEGRVWGDVLEKLWKSIDNKDEFVSLTKNESDFVIKAVRDAKYPPELTLEVNLVRDAVEELRDKTKTAE